MLGILAILGIGFGLAFYTFHGPTGSTVERDKITAAALVQARNALIGYAAGQQSTGSYRPGELPCPATDIYGIEASSCNTLASRIGRLPWKTLGLPDLRDSAGEGLWYAVSNNFKNNAQTGILNSDTPGDYTITGNTAASNVIAIIFAPGTALGTQVRDTANANNVVNYLEGENANGDAIFTTAPASDTFNDKLLLITPDNFFPPILARVAAEAKIFLNAYYNKSGRNYFPNANPFSDSSYKCNTSSWQGRIPVNIQSGCGSQSDWDVAIPGWFFGNNWHQVIFYAISPCYAYPSISNLLSCLFQGNLNVTGVSSNAGALVIVTGRGFPGQTRPCAAASDCLDPVPSTPNNENYNGDTVFVMPAPSATNNDRLLVVSP